MAQVAVKQLRKGISWYLYPMESIVGMPTTLTVGLWKSTRHWVHTAVGSKVHCPNLCPPWYPELQSPYHLMRPQLQGAIAQTGCLTRSCVCTLVLSPSISFFLSGNSNQGLPSPAQCINPLWGRSLLLPRKKKSVQRSDYICNMV